MTVRNILATCAVLASLPVFAGVDEKPIGEAVERHMTHSGAMKEWVQDPERVATEMGDTLETREKVVETFETVKLANLVAPIRFQSGVVNIPDTTVDALGAILERMRDKRNVRLHLIGHADDRPLSAQLAKIYVDNAGLSRERAGQVAEYFQSALTLPPEAISYDWAGDTQPVASNQTADGRAQNRRVEVEVWYDEVSEDIRVEEFLVPHEIRKVKVCRMETVCKLRYVDGHARRARLQNLVLPLNYDGESIDVSDVFVERVRQAFNNLGDKQNVVARFVGHTDDVPLSGRSERIYGTHVGLSKARARRVALAVQDALKLPTSAIESDGRGASKPLTSNDTTGGRARNRRVEVEFWYDDPLQDLPDEPQLCPEDAGAELVTRTYDPAWGDIEPLEFVDGKPVVPPGYTDQLARALADIADKTNPRLLFVGYTRNEHLARRTASVYGDDIGLSASRARRAMDVIAGQMQLPPQKAEFEGRGFVHSDDVVNVGFTHGETSHVAVHAVYDELAILDDYEGVEITRVTHELTPQNPLGLNLMRITVDGEPINDPKRSSSDIQRCTDVALKAANIQFNFDNLRSVPRLSAVASPSRIDLKEVVEFDNPAAPVSFWVRRHASPVHFRMYANYSHFIDRAEVRVFANGASVESEPLAVVDIGLDDVARWEPPADLLQAPIHELAYVLRAYGDDGNFDETRPQPLWVIHDSIDPLRDQRDELEPDADPALLAAYGENDLNLHNIGLGSGTVNVRGSGIQQGETVYVAGRPIPVDENGEFVAEEVLPDGVHTVEVAVLDKDGRGELYLRDFEFEADDWFYVGMADLTLSKSKSDGPIDDLQGANSLYDIDSSADGRLAFFVQGKFGDHWKLTASADTREGPLEDIFSNFLDKSPQSLFRRLDPDYHYPTFGDDSTVEELAPSSGNFFVRLGRYDDYGQWGNFNVSYMNNELGHVDRGLHGANVHYESKESTSFGDRRFVVDAFAAEPGTVASREEFRGTGGSLYFLQRQDILIGSERVRVEVRDKASGIVTSVVNLTNTMDYDIDYLQGRILLAEPLASTADDGLLVRDGGISGDEAYLVVRYEYTPGFDEIDAMSTGGQAHYWFGDYVKLGATVNANEQDETDSTLNAADLTLRLNSGTWLKIQQARSEGLVTLPQVSSDGGFGFDSYEPEAFTDADASARRADMSVAIGELIGFGEATLTAYRQQIDAGFSAPGLTALTDWESFGGTFNMPIGERFEFDVKADKRVQEYGVETRNQEFGISAQLDEHWELSAGYRVDNRIDRSIIVPLTQEQGERVDGVVQLGYDSGATWKAYAFTQETLGTTGDRSHNSRTGVGGSLRMSEKLRVDAEVSDGHQGAGGQIGSNYVLSDSMSVYLNYALDNERASDGLSADQGRQGSLVAGVKSRLADSASVYVEERYQHSDNMNGLTHATGIDFAPTKRWSLGLNTDIGTFEDPNTGAQTERVAGGLQIGYNSDSMQFSSGVEYRDDDVEELDLNRNQRETWLFRNNFKYQFSSAARLLGKFNHSESDSSDGTFYEGGFTEAVVGFAYRPVAHDRFNALAKYTYYDNVPTSDHFTAGGLSADFMQRSHVASVDATYDLTSTVSIGGKYAYRVGEVSLDRENPDYFENNASLFVVRTDVTPWENWEFFVEGRVLDMSDLGERRSGALAMFSHYVGDHVKIGVGYNFTDFSDDLTDLNFDHHGVFVNLTGSM